MSRLYVLVRTRHGERAHVVRGCPDQPPPEWGVPLCRMFDGRWYLAADDVPLCARCVAASFGAREGGALLAALDNPGLTLLAATALREAPSTRWENR